MRDGFETGDQLQVAPFAGANVRAAALNPPEVVIIVFARPFTKD
jgi:hypothetical protein